VRLLIALTGATGLWLIVNGAPVLRRDRLGARVEPYLSALRGRPSRLLVSGAPRTGAVRRWIATRASSPPTERDSDVLARLEAISFEGGLEAFRVQQATWAAFAGGGLACGIVILAGAGVGVDLRALPALVAVGFVTGWLGRDWWLSRQVDARSVALVEELPIAIDLITLSIMAGESVPAACARTSTTIGGGIGEELSRVVAEVRSGTPVVEALEDMARRVPDPSIARFVDALCTGIEKGAPLADVLRAQAEDAREGRRRRLLEMGGRREVLMLVPVVFLVMPVVVVFALFPGLVSLDLLVP
jgi:tight adherence protein C